MQTDWLALSQTSIRTKCCTLNSKRAMTVAHIRTRQKRTSGRNDEKMVARHEQTLFSSSWMAFKMSSLVRYSFFTVIRLVTARNLMIAVRIVDAVDLSCSNQLIFPIRTRTRFVRTSFLHLLRHSGVFAGLTFFFF